MQADERAGLVQQLTWCDGLHTTQRLVVGDELVPLEVALVEAHHRQLRQAGHRLRAFHTGQLLQPPAEFVDLAQRGVAGALVVGRGHHHRQDVGAGGVVLHDEGVVQVVARVGAQLGRTGIEVTDFDAHGQRHRHRQQHRRRGDGDDRRLALRELRQEGPDALQLAGLLLLQAALGRLGADAHVGQQHRQQHEVGEHQHRHADAGVGRQLLDDADVDQRQHGKTHRVAQQRRQAGHEQAPEGVPRRHQLVCAAAHVLQDAVHLLRAMAHADGKHQEGHEHGVRVERVAQEPQQAQLPHHRHQRTGHHDEGGAHATRVGKQHAGADDQRQREEQAHLAHALDEVAHHLGKADDVDVDALALVLGAQLFQLAAKFAVVQRLAGARVLVEQRHEHDAALEVGRHELADLARAFDIGAHLGHALWAAVVAVAHHRVAVQALFGDGHPARVAGPQRLQEGPVHARHQEQFVVDLAQRFQVLLVEDGALPGRHGDADGVAAGTKLVALLQEVDDVGVLRRDRLLEAGGQLHAQGLPAEHSRDQQAQQHDPQAVVEEQPLGGRAAARIEVFQARNDGLGGVVGRQAHGALLGQFIGFWTGRSGRVPPVRPAARADSLEGRPSAGGPGRPPPRWRPETAAWPAGAGNSGPGRG